VARKSAKEADRLPRFGPGEAFGDGPSYEIVNVDGRTNPPITPLGAGMAGVVYRATFKQLGRAIKILSPSRSPNDAFQLPIPVLEDEFQREIRLLSQVTHTNIAKVVDYGRARAGDADYSYYVMEFIEGGPLGTWAESASGRDFVSVIGQLLDALVYLHRLDYYHLDTTRSASRVAAGTRDSSQLPHRRPRAKQSCTA